ncbi:hypothetical protein TSUD_350700 [Trifolium subterraneum]|uniref:Protein kinase domain-containing protein n=1 Tax=Trifolium subterraneum TaxID=3900 RepID=A0A2Z6PC99_TRISU|nr:hypothetical protein TSUD_350700 [Trifolium subterraneum]
MSVDPWLMLMLMFFIISTCTLVINGDTDPNDASVLMNLFQSMNSPSQLNWQTNGNNDPCGQSWTGITCSGNRITEINLANNNFNGGIPYVFSDIPSLISLNLAHNQLQQGLTMSFQKLTSLTTLDVSSNSFTGDLPQTMSSLSSINTMNLQNNQFTGTIDILAALPLQNLNIENNHFTGWIPDQLKNINLQKNGNSWSSGPAPPPPPGTPPINKNNGGHKSSEHKTSSGSSSSDGSKKSGIGGGAIAGIVISILVVGAIVAIFLVKKRSKKSSGDVEKLDNRPLAPHTSNEVHEMNSTQTSSVIDLKTFDTSAASINLKPPPHKSFDEDEFPKKPAVVKKIVAPPPNLKSYSIADLQIATGSFSVDQLIGEGSFGRVYRAQFDDGKVLAVKKIDSSVLPNNLSEDFMEIVSDLSRLHHPNVTELVGYCSEHGQHLLVYEFHKNGSLHEFLHLPDEFIKPLIWNSRVKIALGIARALDSRSRFEQSLVRWATPQLHDIDALAKMVDPALEGLYPVKSLSRFADVVALCVQPEPEFRPPMSEVVQALVRLVQRTNMSKRTFGTDQGGSNRGGDDQDTLDM